MRSVLTFLVLLAATVLDSAGQIAVSDRFGRDLQAKAIKLVDWEGYIANPAVEFTLDVPEEWKPALAVITGSNPRLHFADRRLSRSEPSTVGDTGPSLTLNLPKGDVAQPVVMAIWPDRDALDEAHSLRIRIHTATSGQKNIVIPILVEDQDQDRPIDFPITLDTSFDATNFYTNPRVLEETRKAADDWAYFLSAGDMDETIRGASRSWIWNADGFLSGYWVTNQSAYRGFLLYAWGMRNVGLYSGGAATGAYQTRDGWPIDLVSAGHVAMDIRGNRNVLGWAFYSSENDWWRNDNHPRGMADFYSIVHHQIAHALFFSKGHRRWDQLKDSGGSTAVDIVSYLGKPISVDEYDHLYDSANQKEIVDPASRRGVFGSEGASGEGIMSPYRWIPTKTDLLMAREVGYELRDTTPFRDLSIAAEVALSSTGSEYVGSPISGGVPDYHVEIVSGTLPAGLELDGFSGVIHGRPTSGSSTVRVRAEDQLGASVERDVFVNVANVLSIDKPDDQPSLSVLSNYPNPVSGSTLFSFEVEEPGPVRLEIFDIQGRRVDQVVLESAAPGPREVFWSSTPFPSGVYVARLVTPRRVESLKVPVVR
ncbi:MAG: T9SS type A sorting domain-containing protein [Rhodothermales bacterium]|nr:T9SS type A sorting domain-containing protein [Rhodothermales bacterium]